MLVLAGMSAMFETLFQTLPWSVVILIRSFVLTDQMIPGLTLEMEKSAIEAGGGGGVWPGVGVGCGGRGLLQFAGGAPLAVVKSGLTAVNEWAPSRVTMRHS